MRWYPLPGYAFLSSPGSTKEVVFFTRGGATSSTVSSNLDSGLWQRPALYGTSDILTSVIMQNAIKRKVNI